MKASKLKHSLPGIFYFLTVIRKIVNFKYPKFIAMLRIRLETRNPITINQKILYKIANDRASYLTMFADKHRVREYVSQKIGSKYLTKYFHVGLPGESIPWAILPEEFVLKGNHSSGGSVIIWRGARTIELPKKLDYLNWATYVVHPEKIDRSKIDHFFKKLLSQNYASFAGFCEYAYLDIAPRLICEELLLDATGKIPDDIKFWCIHGRVELIQVDTARFGDHSRQLFTREWEKIDTKLKKPFISEDIPLPNNLQEMINIAEQLSEHVDLVRVDLYDLGNRIIFGELTNYPGGGLEKFDPIDLDFHLGSLLNQTY